MVGWSDGTTATAAAGGAVGMYNGEVIRSGRVSPHPTALVFRATNIIFDDTHDDSEGSALHEVQFPQYKSSLLVVYTWVVSAHFVGSRQESRAVLIILCTKPCLLVL